jgi:hypothetical protein
MLCDTEPVGMAGRGTRPREVVLYGLQTSLASYRWPDLLHRTVLPEFTFSEVSNFDMIYLQFRSVFAYDQGWGIISNEVILKKLK